MGREEGEEGRPPRFVNPLPWAFSQIPTLADDAAQPESPAEATQDPLNRPRGGILGLAFTLDCVFQVLIPKAVSGLPKHPDPSTRHTAQANRT